MVFYFTIYFLTILCLFLSSLHTKYKGAIIVCLTLALICIAGFRGNNVDRDHSNYMDFFQNLVGRPGEYFTNYAVNSFNEPMYYLIPSVFKYILGINVKYVFMVFAVLGIGLKVKGILKLTDLVFLSLAVYTAHIYWLHDLTQIRSGVASGFLLLCIPEIYNRNLIKFLILVFISTLFHYSSVIILPLYFLKKDSLNVPLYIAVLLVPIIMYFFQINLFTLFTTMKLGVFSDKLKLYNDLLDQGTLGKINVFNVIFLIELALCVFFIAKAKTMQLYNKYAILLIKIFSFALAIFVLLSPIPVFAFRISGLLEVTDVILIPMLIYFIRPQYVAYLILIVFCLCNLFIDVVYVQMMKPYYWEF